MSKTNMGIRVKKSKYGEDASVIGFYTSMPDDVAQAAAHYIERWGMVAGTPDGEDSAGRQKFRLSTTEELVTRAFDIAEACEAEARKRGHMIDAPDLNELNAENDKKEAEAAVARKS